MDVEWRNWRDMKVTSEKIAVTLKNSIEFNSFSMQLQCIIYLYPSEEIRRLIVIKNVTQLVH